MTGSSWRRARSFARVVATAALMPLVGARPTPPILTVARLQYDGGGDWYANPSSIPNLLAAMRGWALTSVSCLSDVNVINSDAARKIGRQKCRWRGVAC